MDLSLSSSLRRLRGSSCRVNSSWSSYHCVFVSPWVFNKPWLILLENGAKDRPHRDLRQDSSQSIFFRSVHRQEYYPSSVHESHVLVDLRQTNEGKGSLWRLNPRLKLSSENLFARTAEDKDNLTLHNALTVLAFSVSHLVMYSCPNYAQVTRFGLVFRFD